MSFTDEFYRVAREFLVDNFPSDCGDAVKVTGVREVMVYETDGTGAPWLHVTWQDADGNKAVKQVPFGMADLVKYFLANDLTREEK